MRGGPSRERLLLSDGLRKLRLDIRAGTLLQGPVRLRYALDGIVDLGHKLLTLRRLVALRRLGRFPSALFPLERRAPRWILLLRVLDAATDDASQREIAAALFGTASIQTDWRSNSDYLRLRVQRLARAAAALAEGGYLSVLRQGQIL